MENKTRLFVSKKNVLTWLMALCMVSSAVARIMIVGKEGADWWCQIFLPIAASLLYAAVTLISGKERFYKTAIPVWMIAAYFFFVFSAVDFGYYDIMITILYAGILIFYAVLYTQITSEKASLTWLLPFIFLFGIYVVLNGHLSPGGGFSGGAILGGGLILLSSIFGQEKLGSLLNLNTTTRLSVGCLLVYAALKGYSFFTGANHVGWEIPKGTPGNILSAGFILPLNICVGIIVACTMYSFYALFSQGEEV